MTAQVVTGRSTKFRDVKHDGNLVVGQVTTVDEQPVPGGKVVVTGWDERREEHSVHADVEPGKGVFRTKLSGKWTTIEAYYTGADGYADCASEVNGSRKPTS